MAARLSLKFLVVSLFFYFAGIIAAKFIPPFGFNGTFIPWAIILAGGILLMILKSDDPDYPVWAQRLTILGKIAFFIAMIFSTACLFNFFSYDIKHHGYKLYSVTAPTVRGPFLLFVPLFFIASQVYDLDFFID